MTEKTYEKAEDELADGMVEVTLEGRMGGGFTIDILNAVEDGIRRLITARRTGADLDEKKMVAILCTDLDPVLRNLAVQIAHETEVEGWEDEDEE